MTITWRNVTTVIGIALLFGGYVLRFEAVAKEQKSIAQEVKILKDGMTLLVAFRCQEHIDRAVTKEEKQKAYKVCNPHIKEKI